MTSGHGGVAYPPGVDFAFAHRFDADVGRVAAALLDEDYQRSLDGIEPLETRRLLDQTEQPGGLVVRRTRCVLGVDLGAAKKFLGNAEPAWVEVATWDPGKLRWEWVILPEVAAELLSAEGAIELHADDGHTIRRVSGDVRVRVPLYGGRVEGVVVQSLERAYGEEADRLAAWLEA